MRKRALVVLVVRPPSSPLQPCQVPRRNSEAASQSTAHLGLGGSLLGVLCSQGHGADALVRGDGGEEHQEGRVARDEAQRQAL